VIRWRPRAPSIEDRLPGLGAWAREAGDGPHVVLHGDGVYGPVEVFDAEFSGAGGDRIRAWYLRPAGAAAYRDLILNALRHEA